MTVRNVRNVRNVRIGRFRHRALPAEMSAEVSVSLGNGLRRTFRTAPTAMIIDPPSNREIVTPSPHQLRNA